MLEKTDEFDQGDDEEAKEESYCYGFNEGFGVDGCDGANGFNGRGGGFFGGAVGSAIGVGVGVAVSQTDEP